MIKDSCKCGAEFQVTDGDVSFQRYAQERFLSAHRVCREKPEPFVLETTKAEQAEKVLKDFETDPTFLGCDISLKCPECGYDALYNRTTKKIRL